MPRFIKQMFIGFLASINNASKCLPLNNDSTYSY